MRRSWAALQLLCFLLVGAAMSAPEFPRLLSDWSGGTIYPWWAPAYVVVGVILSGVCAALEDDQPMLPAVLVVLAGQLAGLGFVAVKHWEPSFGMGGGFAGRPDQLAQLAWVVGAAGIVAALVGVGQLVAAGAFPIPAVRRDALLLGGTGMLVVLVLPFAIGEGTSELLDVTSLGAFVLLYSAPIGGCVIGAAWLRGRLRGAVLGSCAAAAACSGLGLITDLNLLHGRPALLGLAALLAVLAVWGPTGRDLPAVPGPSAA
jgi:hypothetical protein